MLPQGHDGHQLCDVLPGADDVDDAAAPGPGHAGHRDALA
jgi:hypothetical protein